MQFLDGLGGDIGGAVNVERRILAAVEAQKERGIKRVVVVLDGMDFLLAGMGATIDEILNLVGTIREVRPIPYCVSSKIPPSCLIPDTEKNGLFSKPIPSLSPPQPTTHSSTRKILPSRPSTLRL